MVVIVSLLGGCLGYLSGYLIRLLPTEEVVGDWPYFGFFVVLSFLAIFFGLTTPTYYDSRNRRVTVAAVFSFAVGMISYTYQINSNLVASIILFSYFGTLYIEIYDRITKLKAGD